MKNNRMTLLGGALVGLKLPSISAIGDPKVGHMAIDGTQIVRRSVDGSWESLANFGPVVPTGIMEFTSLGEVGPVAPTNERFLQSYLSKGYAWAELPEWFGVVDGIQTLTIAEQGRYRLKLVSPRPTFVTEQRGATIEVELDLQVGDKLRMVVGQLGMTKFGGCGATSVELNADGSSSRVVAIAGGAGGQTSAFSSSSRGRPNLSTPGNGLGGASASTGTASSTSNSGGGASFLRNGEVKAGGIASERLSATAKGGTADNQSRKGGFGGGGGGGYGTVNYGNGPLTINSCGGGGGYTGGPAHSNTGDSAGTGGTCFVGSLSSLTLISRTLTTTEVGSVTIQKVS